MKKCLKVPKFALEKAAQQNIGRPHWQGLISKAWKAWKHSSSLTNTLTPGDLYHLNVPIYGGVVFWFWRVTTPRKKLSSSWGNGDFLDKYVPGPERNLDTSIEWTSTEFTPHKWISILWHSGIFQCRKVKPHNPNNHKDDHVQATYEDP